jgi:hypothetical protein
MAILALFASIRRQLVDRGVKVRTAFGLSQASMMARC